jgi:YfiH family protein
MTPPSLTCPALAVPHGFFTRHGGVSTGPFASLNGSLSGGDDPDRVASNRARVAASLGLSGGAALLGLTQVHGTHVVRVSKPWSSGNGPSADAMVTDRPGTGLVVITADCAPVLLADAHRGVVAAAHAGWRGAVAGILERTVDAMRALGASRIDAAIGPCIGPESYQVGPDLRHDVLQASPWAETCFLPDPDPARFRFDLARYCAARLRQAGVAVHTVTADTCAEPDRFFSHRRRVLAGGGPIGHQMSAVAA